MVVNANTDVVSTNSDDIFFANAGISTSSMDLVGLIDQASMIPSGSSSEITWKDQVLTKNFVSASVAQTTPGQTDPREDYLDSIDNIFGMHTEYMPIIREFRCLEDAAGLIAGFEVEYFIKPVLDTRF